MKHVRLPHYIKPEKYKLLVKPNLENFTFEGEETISLALDKTVSSITLHAKELKINEVKFQISNSKYQTNAKALPWPLTAMYNHDNLASFCSFIHSAYPYPSTRPAFAGRAQGP